MEAPDFDDSLKILNSIEKSKIAYKPYSGEISIPFGLKFSPSEYSKISYEDVLKYYSRILKIQKTTQRLAGAEKSKKSEKDIEAESAIQKISKETSVLSVPEETGSGIKKSRFEGLEFETQTPEKEHPPKYREEYETEKQENKMEEMNKSETLEDIPVPDISDLELDSEKKSISPVVFENVVAQRKKKEEIRHELEKEITPKTLKKEGDISYLDSHIFPKLEMFPVLSSDPKEFGINKYENILSHIESGPQKMSKREITGKMLELTKRLFREKITSEKEKIKSELIRLKNLSSSMRVSKKLNLSTALQTIPLELESEFFDYLSSFENLFLQNLNSTSKNFYDSFKHIEEINEDRRRSIFDYFCSDLNLLKTQSEELAGKTQKFLIDANTIFLNQIIETGNSHESKLARGILLNILKKYPEKFSSSSKSISEFISLIKLKASYDIKINNDKNLAVLSEVLSLNESILLNDLKSKDPKNYSLYIHHAITKIEALMHARKMILKEKGLSNDLLSKYFVSG